jgi:predicted esterase
MLSYRPTIITITTLLSAFLCRRAFGLLNPAIGDQKTDCLLVPTLSFTRLQMTKRDDDTPRVVRVLALHGSEGTGPDFVERIKPLVDSLLTQHIELRLTQITAPFEKGNGYAWWTMPPGVRSFTATEYGGFETSASLVVDTIEKEGPFDLIFGHSQGAILISALLALQRLPTHPSVGYILNGVAMPNPFKEQLESLNIKQESTVPPPRVLFVLGENDKINALEIGERVKDAMEGAGLDVQVCYHTGGHSVPVQDQTAVKAISTWITEGIR